MRQTETEKSFLSFNKLNLDYSVSKNCLKIRVSDRRKARNLATKEQELIARIAFLFRCSRATIIYEDDNAFEVLSMSHQPLKIEQKLWMSDEFRALSTDYIKIAERMTKSSCPMILTRMSDNRLIWTNDKHIEVTRQSPEQVIKQKMSDYWNPADLLNLQKRLRQDGDFFHRYQCRVIDNEWEQFYSRFELLFDGLYRLATIHEHEPILSM